MKKTIILSVVLLAIALPATAFGQSALDAINALRKFQVMVNNGISYNDYKPALAYVKSQVSRYTESPEAQSNPKISEALNKAVAHYEFAYTVWAYKFSGKKIQYLISPRYAPELYNEIRSNYPDIEIKNRYWPWENSIKIQDAVFAIWDKASLEIKNATEFLSQAVHPKADVLPKSEVPKTDIPKVDAPKVEVPKADIPKADAPKVEVPKPDVLPKADVPKAGIPKADAHKVEVPKAEAIKAEEKTGSKPKDVTPDIQKQLDELKKENEKLTREIESLKKELESMKAKSD